MCGRVARDLHTPLFPCLEKAKWRLGVGETPIQPKDTAVIVQGWGEGVPEPLCHHKGQSLKAVGKICFFCLA